MAKYINTKVDRPHTVVADLAEIVGAGTAQGIVGKWFQEYNEFVYIESTGDLVFFKKSYSGYWESVDANLSKLN
jgi:hypothetical protein